MSKPCGVFGEKSSSLEANASVFSGSIPIFMSWRFFDRNP